jgi:hypothetical protein
MSESRSRLLFNLGAMRTLADREIENQNVRDSDEDKVWQYIAHIGTGIIMSCSRCDCPLYDESFALYDYRSYSHFQNFNEMVRTGVEKVDPPKI